MSSHDLASRPIHLGPDGGAVVEPAFPNDHRAMQWYQDYAARHAADIEQSAIALFITPGAGTRNRAR